MVHVDLHAMCCTCSMYAVQSENTWQQILWVLASCHIDTWKETKRRERQPERGRFYPVRLWGDRRSRCFCRNVTMSAARFRCGG